MVNRHVVAKLSAAGIVLLFASPVRPDSTQTPKDGAGVSPVVSATRAPAGTEMFAVEWVDVSAPGLGVMLAAVARPAGKGPFPAVVLLHGTHGFAQEYVRLAQDLARGGLLAVAACWFSGGGGPGARFVTPIRCPQAPPMSSASSPGAQETVDALVRAAGALPGARPDRVGLFGHSRGAGAALNFVLRAGTVQAAVLDSAGYPGELADLASQVKAPVLLLHGTADGPADGGSAMTSVERARDFEAALRRAGKPVEAWYYEGAGHNGIFTSPTQYEDEVRRMVSFFRQRARD
jgi:dienelactone hydrolase